MSEFSISEIAVAPENTEAAKFGAERIKETRQKLNQVIAALNAYAPTVPTTPDASSRVIFSTVGLTAWTVPAGVTSINVEILQAAGGGSGTSLVDMTGTVYGSPVMNNLVGAGGTGESFRYNSLAVIPGETLNFIVGEGGAGAVLSAENTRPATVTTPAGAGGNSAIIRASSAVTLATAKGGYGGDSYEVLEGTQTGGGAPYIFAYKGALSAGGTNAGYSKFLAGTDGRLGKPGNNYDLATPTKLPSTNTYTTTSINGAKGNDGVIVISY